MAEGNIRNGTAIVLSIINTMLVLIAILNTDIILPKQLRHFINWVYLVGRGE